jgi:hypothetical protein
MKKLRKTMRMMNRCETSKHLEAGFKEHKYNMTQGLLEKSILAQHAYEEGHQICLNEAKVVQIERNTTYRESAHMSLIDHPINQPSLDISPIWTPVITAEVRKLQFVQCILSGKICFSFVGTIRSISSLP